MTFQTEFPDFPAADMPPIPKGFEDVSWANESSPSFQHEGLGLYLGVDYADASLSEWPEERASGDLKRFCIIQMAKSESGWQMPDDNIKALLVETDDWNEVLAVVLGETFAGVLREWLTEDDFDEMRVTNFGHENDGICASHDYCDANMAMDEAFTKALGRGPDIEDLPDGKESPDVALWNAAWNYAKPRHLTASIWTVGDEIEYENGWQAVVMHVHTDPHFAVVRKETVEGATFYQTAWRDVPVLASESEDDTWCDPLEGEEGDFHTLDGAIAALPRAVAEIAKVSGQ